MAIYLGYDRVGIIKTVKVKVFANTTTVSGTYSVVLNNSIGDEIDQMTIEGNTTKKILPDEYQQVEHLTNSGTQRIDTGLIPTNSTSIDITYQSLQPTGTSQYIAGSRLNASTTVEYAINGSSSNAYWDVRLGGQTVTITDVNRMTNKYRSYLNITKGTGTWTLTHTTTGTTYTKNTSGMKVNATANLFLFAYNNIDANTHANLRIYGCKIYEAGVLVRNYLPCYRKSDNEAGMYDLVENKFYTNTGTGKFAIGSDSESQPTPEMPAEIISVGNKTKNLFGNYETIENQYIDASGNYVNKEGINTYRYIAVEPNKTYTISGKSASKGYIRVAEYTEDKTFIKRVYNPVMVNPIITITTTATTKYLALCPDYNFTDGTVTNSHIYDIQIEPDGVATHFEPFGYKIPINIYGDNLANENTIQENKLISSATTGTIVDSQIYNTLYMEVQEGERYVFNNFVRADGTSLRGCFYDSNGAWVSAFEETTVTIPSGVKYIGRSFNKETQNVGLYKISLTKEIYIKEPLRKLGDIADYIDYKNQKVIRKVWAEKPTAYETTYFGKAFAVLTTYQVFNSNTSRRYVDCNYMEGTNAQPTTSERAGKVFIGSASNYVGFGSTTTFPIVGDNATASEIKVFKDWLDSHDVLIYYGLATPIEEKIDMPMILTRDVETYIEIDTELEPTKLEVSYWEEIK